MKEIVLNQSLERFGWKKYSFTGTLYFKGYLHKHSVQEIDGIFSSIVEGNLSDSEISKRLAAIYGRFAFVYQKGNRTLCIVDKTQSIPLFYFEAPTKIHISGEASALVALMPEKTVDHEALLQFRMCGYTIGKRSLMKGLQFLNSGEYVMMESGRVENPKKYFIYSPWTAKDNHQSREELQKELKEITLGNFERIVKTSNGRPIVVPVSGGYDSRLVASALKELDAPNVYCLSYGKPGNFDAEMGGKVAKKLGFKWEFYPLDLKNQIAYLKSERLRDYFKFAESYYSVPFYQDNFVINQLAERGIVPKNETIFINGNTGDYISGGHVPVPFKNFNDPANLEKVFFDKYIKKHCALWANLLTEENMKLVQTRLEEEIKSCGLNLTLETMAPIFEFLEYKDRQSKYVISGQRSYEFFGFDWRLPLWDDEYIYFWQKVPTEFKYNQNLYKGMLMEENWGGVWKDLPLNVKYINPTWIIPFRSFLKTVHMPLGKEKWYEFEKRYLAYFMEPLGLYSMWPYWKIAGDKRGARNIVSWRSEQYLKDKNFLM